jgi:two-component system cell cycle sensor histidine kinase/response regulator CckA
VSEPGVGSVFRIQFPLTRASGAFAIDESVLLAERTRAISENNNDRRYTALVVDDDESVRRQTAKLLERAGYEVWVARDGEEALRVVGNNVDVLDIAVTDVNMPNLNGVELAGLLLAIKPGLPILFMSGEGADELEQEGLLGPAASFLHKPYKTEVLLRQVKILIRTAADAASIDQAATPLRVGLIAPPSAR